MATSHVLAMYNPKRPTKVSTDASLHGLGAVLLQQTTQGWRPVACASSSMTDAETYEIEKEALALTWTWEKFSPYILGMETDHKPLRPVPLLSHTHLDNLPPRVLCFHLRLMRFSYTICYVPGKLLCC